MIFAVCCLGWAYHPRSEHDPRNQFAVCCLGWAYHPRSEHDQEINETVNTHHW